MNKYSVTYNPTGEDFGIYSAESFDEVLDVMAYELGYDSFADYSADNDVDAKDLQLTIQK